MIRNRSAGRSRATRGDLSDNVNALGDKVNPGSIARRQVGRVRGAAVSVKEACWAATPTPPTPGSDRRPWVTRCPTPRDAVARKAQGSPIAAGLIAFGAGLLVSSMLPASRAEQQAAERSRTPRNPWSTT